MQIKPVLKIDNGGEIDIFTKQNGSKKAMSFVLNEVEKHYSPFDDAPIVVVDATAPEAAKEIVAKLKEKLPDAKIWTQPVGPVIGAHCGPGTYGVIFPADCR